MVMSDQQLNQYFSRDWIGTVKGQYENVCHLRFEEIPNFIRYAGMYADLEIFDSHDSEFLLDTYGPFVNRIWPDLSSFQREQYRDIINQIASQINAEFENITDEPIEKVKVFIDQIQDQSLTQSDANEMQMKM